MHRSLVRKGLVLGIILLFVGTSIVPSNAILEGEYKVQSLPYQSENRNSVYWWDSDWQYCKKITISPEMADSDLQNFPVLIHNISMDFVNHAQSDGDDFVFTSFDNLTVYNHEIEQYDYIIGELVTWVNFTYLSSVNPTIIWLYYGNPYCYSQQNISGTWNSEYVAVWHMADVSTGIIDSTGNGFNGVGGGNPTYQQIGKVGYTIHYDGNDNFVISSPVRNDFPITYEAWAKREGGNRFQFVLSNSGEQYHGIALAELDTDEYLIEMREPGNYRGIYIPTTNDNWNYFAGWFDGQSSSNGYFRMNSIELFDDPGSEGASSDDYNLKIGSRYSNERYWHGWIDEVRISKVDRSSSWILSSYLNQNDPESYIIVGEEQLEINNPPYTPSNPSPTNHATDVDINANLYWSGGDPDPGDTVTYDVYFGTSSSPPQVVTGQSGTNFVPGTMSYSTKYYWKIVSWDNHGASTPGPVWDFTTGSEPNDPPNPPSDPIPLDGSTDVSIDTLLSWTCSDPDGDPLVYDVYLEADDSTPDDLVSDDQTSTIYDPEGLDYGTTYYWQIIAKDSHSATNESPIWSFTIEESTPDLDCKGSLSWTDVEPGASVSGSFTVENIGKPTSLLSWEVESYPDWGTWTFTPDSGVGLTPEVGPINIIVEVVAPDEEEKTFTGEVKIVNSEDPDDTCVIDVSLATPVNQQVINPLLQMILERFPMLERMFCLFPVFNRMLNMD